MAERLPPPPPLLCGPTAPAVGDAPSWCSVCRAANAAMRHPLLQQVSVCAARAVWRALLANRGRVGQVPLCVDCHGTVSAVLIALSADLVWRRFVPLRVAFRPVSVRRWLGCSF